MFFRARRRATGRVYSASKRPESVRRRRFGKIRRMPGSGEGAIVGVDVGGTKVAVGHVVGREVVASVEHPTPLANAQDVIAAIEAGGAGLARRGGPPRASGGGGPSPSEVAARPAGPSGDIPPGGG